MTSSTPCCVSGAVHTDVVIVGNGPSAISLSFMLSGNRPYFNGATHPNDILTKKLQNTKDISLVEQDLEFLCEGLEGRSPNPVALLFDALSHPEADLGADNSTVLDWKHEEQYEIPHVVLGKTRAGGSWQRMDGSMQTVSQNNWMELPTVPFREWLANRKCSSLHMGNHSGRATVGDVKDYYSEFVKEKRLQRHFYDYHTVTSVQKVFQVRTFADSESGEVEPCCKNVKKNHGFLWEVRGYRLSAEDGDFENGNTIREEFCFVSHYVILATGTYDIPNRLGITGETLPHVVHSLPDFEKIMKSGELIGSCDPVLVIGAGLSAADTILMATENNIPVIHVFRRGPNDPSLIFRKLPSSMYPEYHRVHSMMRGKTETELYRPYSKHKVVEIKYDKKVLIQSDQGDTISSFETSMVVVMIGSRSDLSFLPNGGRHLGVVQNWQIDSKHNPIQINPFTYESVYEPGLFALGPLVSDNFVRFGVGGALGIVNYLRKWRKAESV
ncbi:oxidative stress-induced growth inhibitor 2-like [Haliotis rufescens]|uniref:oxidative stress-induced growth inhibitor 2-like n=1 Tax=Haliotis rufescens TaxID=6454 RepID=UPI001EAFECE0|nr:oxidative stress-induced growth inhibitor 2-like [Haliotis rufescens]XP_046368149.1 oxidative stress-induced growth inhibitor 2-like [Haliotis rufescens]XP_046368150.1 oxidative stress-induced growth inhibitor 2-like [Haliotis rufescens]XP_046368151.1 oxidative stress-induced growth inhibitor 2-like [Haliotis rufescens]